MTKAERMVILLWSEKISDEAQKRDGYFAQLQQLTREARMIVTCNPLVNRDHLQGTQFAIRADILYTQCNRTIDSSGQKKKPILAYVQNGLSQ